jgi:hypothetical protein
MINRSLDFVLGLIFSFSRLEAKKWNRKVLRQV